MARRALPPAASATLTALAVAATVAVGGCGTGTAAHITAAQEHARIAFIKAHEDFTDRQLAQLCPGLYPRDFLTNTKKYKLAKPDKNAKAKKVTATDRAQAKAAGCDVRA